MSNTASPPPEILVRPRIYIGDAISLGPGKVDLLRLIDERHSIAAAARELHIPYKRAWFLISTLNQGFGRPVVETAAGGKGGGVASLTPLGRRLVECYDTLQERLNIAAASELAALRALTD